MAEYGEWNRKGAVLSDVTAQKEYGVTRDFIVKGVHRAADDCRSWWVGGRRTRPYPHSAAEGRRSAASTWATEIDTVAEGRGPAGDVR
jgi:hypothetical protein